MTHAIDPVQQAEAGLVKAEPAMALGFAAAVVGYVMTLLVTHGVITSIQASTLTQQVLPGATALTLMGLGWLIRHFVSPVGVFAARVEAEVEKRLAAAPALDQHAAF